MDLKTILESASDKILSEQILDNFKELEQNFYLKSWKTSELDAGHFVESIRRFIELKLFGKYTPIGKSLPSFNDSTLSSYLNATGDESYRLHIPRALLTIYGIRNKRGVGHVSLIKPNRIDATLILSISKWVLAEVIRLNSTYTIEQTEGIIDEVIERNVEAIWETGDIKRILINGLKLSEQILILLFNSKTLTDQQLFDIIENGNLSYLKRTLKNLHRDRLLEYKTDGSCLLSPKGAAIADKILSQH